MSWPSARAAIKTALTTAAADVTPSIGLVRYGEPDTLNRDTIAFWLEPGTRPSSTPEGANSLNKVFIERGVLVRAYLRGAVRAGSVDEELEDRLVAIEEAMFTRLWGAFSLGGNTIGLRIDDSTYGWELVGGDRVAAATGAQLCRTVDFIAWYDMPAVASIVA